MGAFSPMNNNRAKGHNVSLVGVFLYVCIYKSFRCVSYPQVAWALIYYPPRVSPIMKLCLKNKKTMQTDASYIERKQFEAKILISFKTWDYSPPFLQPDIAKR